MKTVHRQEDGGGNKLFCPHCNRPFTRKDNMGAHIRQRHRPEAGANSSRGGNGQAANENGRRTIPGEL